MEIRRRLRRDGFDLVHAHFGLTGWCARLAGARPLVVTFHGTDVHHPRTGPLSRRLARRIELAAPVSHSLLEADAGWPGLPRVEGACAVLPCGADLERFRPSDRVTARTRLGLDADGRYLLFPAGPGRREKRHDRARRVAELASAELLTGGGIDSAAMPDWVNAADAVLVTSDYEGFGLAAIEALACDVPVLSTPVGIAPVLLAGVEGCLVERFDAGRWAALARTHLTAGDPRVRGRARASWFGIEPMAARVAAAYRELLRSSGI
jgi:glycosyltransferase involved in cell wall biosynthesis